jgi:HNH endonuclease/AP2 domain
MDNVEWHPFFYNGQETNIEVTRCGRVRRVPKDWKKRNNKLGEIDFSWFVKNKTYFRFPVCIKGKIHKAISVHQVIACIFLGHDLTRKDMVIDHIDSNKTNNHVDNLRIVTYRENASKEKTQNRKIKLPTGVSLTPHNRYRTVIGIKSIHYNLGTYGTLEEALDAYQEALKKINEGCFVPPQREERELPVGVQYRKDRNKYYTGIEMRVNGVRMYTYLGTYDTSEEASNAYQEALIKKNNGTFQPSVKVARDLPIGIAYHESHDYYSARITHKYKNIYLKTCDTLEEACSVRKKAEEDIKNGIFVEPKHKLSGLPIGVYSSRLLDRYNSKITFNKKTCHLGTFFTIEDASKAYQEAKISLTNWISENKDPNDWFIEYTKKINIGEQLPIHFN